MCFTRLEKHDEFKEELAHMKPRFDDALLRTWSNMKRHGVSLRTWVEVHRDILGLFMEMDDL